MDKYVRSTITPFLIIYPGSEARIRNRDVEEEGMVEVDVTLEELEEGMGRMSIVGEWAVRRGLEEWRKRGYGEEYEEWLRREGGA